MELADAEVWSAVLGCDVGRKDPKRRERLYHLQLVQNAFLRIWRRESLETPYPEFDNREALLRWVSRFRPFPPAFKKALDHLV
jgi:hypothetical protein